jgi:hypothetical protein
MVILSSLHTLKWLKGTLRKFYRRNGLGMGQITVIIHVNLFFTLLGPIRQLSFFCPLSCHLHISISWRKGEIHWLPELIFSFRDVPVKGLHLFIGVLTNNILVVYWLLHYFFVEVCRLKPEYLRGHSSRLWVEVKLSHGCGRSSVQDARRRDINFVLDLVFKLSEGPHMQLVYIWLFHYQISLDWEF